MRMLPICMAAALAFTSHDVFAQMTVIVVQNSMTCIPANPVQGPDGQPRSYAPYQVAWNGDNTIIIKLADAPASAMGNAVRVKTLSKTSVLMRSKVGPHRYTVKLDFKNGYANFNYGRIDRCTIN